MVSKRLPATWSSPAASRLPTASILLHHRNTMGRPRRRRPFYDLAERGRERSAGRRFGVISGMIETAETLAGRYAIDRTLGADALRRREPSPRRPRRAASRIRQRVVVAVPAEARRSRRRPGRGHTTDATVGALGKLAPIISPAAP